MLKLEEFYRETLGEPTKSQKLLARYMLRRAAKGKKWEARDPKNRHPRDEISKLYRYDKNHGGMNDSSFPYEIEYPERGLPFYAYKLGQTLTRRKLGAISGFVQAASKIYDTEDIDEILARRLRNGAFSTGF